MSPARNPITEKLLTVPLDPREYDGVFDALGTHELLEFAFWSQRQASAFDTLALQAIKRVTNI